MAQRTEAGEARLRFRIVGSFQVELNGMPVAPHEVGSRKGRTLLKLLVVNRRRTVSVDVIAEALWPDEEPARLQESVAVLVSRLRARFGTEVIEGGRDGYRLSTGPAVQVDLDEAERLVREAERRFAIGEPSLARVAVDAALSTLEGGTVVEDEPYADWCEAERAHAATLLTRARRAGWEAASMAGDHHRAATLAGAAVATDHLDEEAHRALMSALARGGGTAQAIEAYERLRAALAETLGTDPSPESEDLYLRILRGVGVEGSVARPIHPASIVPDRAAEPGFVGRMDEVAQLSARWSDAASGHPGLVLIHGEPGIGKTTLARHIATLAAETGGRVVHTRCYEAERSLFLQPILEAVRTVALSLGPDALREAASERTGTLADLVPDIGQILRPLDYVPVGPELERRRAFEAITAFWLRVARERPILLVVDDLHNADSSTVELLHLLNRRLSIEPALIVGTVRADEGREVIDQLSEAATLVELGPLEPAAVDELARSMGAPELGAQVHALSRGHPLFVVEALRALGEDQGSADEAIPETLRGAVLARLRRTGPKVEDLLRAASVLGTSFDLVTAARLTHLREEDAAELAESALRARLIVEAGTTYEFANDLIREVMYRTTPMPTRVVRHRRAASLLEGNPEAVATHAAAGGEWPLALRNWLEAAAMAARRYANRDAERLLDRALEAALAAEDLVGEARVHLERGRAREALREFEGAFQDQERALSLARQTGQRSIEVQSLREHAGDLMVARGLPTRSCVAYLEAALPIAVELGDRKMENSILSRLAVVFGNCLEFDRSIAYGRRALERARDGGDEAALVWALDGLKMAAAHTGDFASLRSYVAELELLVRRSRDLILLEWALLESSYEPMARARWDDAISRMREALAVTRQIDDRSVASFVTSHLSWIERSRGDSQRSLELGLDALSMAEEIGHAWWIPFAESMVGWTLEERSELDDAASHLRHGLALAEPSGAEFYLVRCLAHLAWTTWRLGDKDEALQFAARAETMLRAVRAPPGTAFLHGAHAYVALGRVLVAAGEIDRAGALIHPVLRAAEASDWKEAVAGTALVAGRVMLAGGDAAGGARRLRQSLSVAVEAGLPYAAGEATAALQEAGLAPGTLDDH